MPEQAGKICLNKGMDKKNNYSIQPIVFTYEAQVQEYFLELILMIFYEYYFQRCNMSSYCI